MKSQVQVVIIGGGIIGCSIAYHLSQMGWTDVILLEKDDLTSGSTSHSVGLVSQFRSVPAQMLLMNYSIHLYSQLQTQVGSSIGWEQVGSLRLASSKERLKALQRMVSRARGLGLDVGIISPNEALKIFPYMTIDNVYGAVYIPEDGYLDSIAITRVLAQQAKAKGVTICTGVRVTDIKLSNNNSVTAVITDQGTIKTEVVVNAAGMWASRIGAMVEANIPITPLMHQYLLTKPIPGHELPPGIPVVRDPDNLAYVRESGKGFLIGGFELTPEAWSIEGVPWEFTQQFLPPKWDLFDSLMDGAMQRIPILEQSEVIKLINGVDAVTPDGQYCLGPVPGLHGFYVAAGMSFNGIGGAGGVGKIIAEWIIEGSPSIDVRQMNIRRFNLQHINPYYCAERAREVYKYHYYLRYPNDENEWGRPLRTSSLYPCLQQLGAVFGEKNGWEQANYFQPELSWRQAGAEQRFWGWGHPPYFEQIGYECKAIRERVGLVDMTSFGKIEVQGSGALALLQYLTNNNINKPIGTLVYTQFLNNWGGIESNLTIVRLAQNHFRIITGIPYVANDLGWIISHLPNDGSVTVKDVTDNWVCIALWGPKARHVLQSVSNNDLSNKTFPYMTAQTIFINKVSIWAQRISVAGELGWELYVSPTQAVEVWNTLMTAGKPFSIQPVGYKALDSLRLEKGYPYWGTDLTPTDNPYEAGLGFCVKLDEKKGGFIGRDALMSIKELGLNRCLCTLTLLDNSGPIYGDEAVYVDDEVIGRIRSGGYGYTIEKNIALAYLPVTFCKIDTEVKLEMFGEFFPAKVTAHVLYDPDGKRLRS